MPALREIFAYFGVKFDDKALKQGDRAVTQTTGSLTRLDTTVKKTGASLASMVQMVGGALAVRGLVGFAQNVMNSTNDLQDFADTFRISITEMQGWRFVAERNGLSVQDLAGGLSMLQDRAQDAIRSGGAMAASFQRAGISIQDLRADGDDATALMERLADATENETDAGKRLDIATTLLGRRMAIKLLPALAGGRRGLQAFRREGERLGGRGLPELAEQTQLVEEKVAEMRLRWESVRNNILVRVAPALTTLAERFGPVVSFLESAIPKLLEVAQNSNVFTAALVVAGIAIAAAWGPAAVSAMAAILPFIALVALVDEVITTVQGGDSLIRRFMDRFMGEGDSARAINEIQEALQGVVVLLVEADEKMRGFLGLASNAEEYGDPLQRRTAERAHAAGSSVGWSRQATWGESLGNVLRLITPDTSMSPFGPITRNGETVFDPQQAPRWAGGGGMIRGNGGASTTINAPSTVTVHVTEAENPERTAQVVREEVAADRAAQLRTVQRSLGRPR
jgi:hypothetical protein